LGVQSQKKSKGPKTFFVSAGLYATIFLTELKSIFTSIPNAILIEKIELKKSFY